MYQKFQLQSSKHELFSKFILSSPTGWSTSCYVYMYVCHHFGPSWLSAVRRLKLGNPSYELLVLANVAFRLLILEVLPMLYTSLSYRLWRLTHINTRLRSSDHHASTVLAYPSLTSKSNCVVLALSSWVGSPSPIYISASSAISHMDRTALVLLHK